MKQIAIFNHKGGVAKTTTTFYLGWMLAELGKRVLLVDGDPQCNLTGVVLGEFDGVSYPFETEDARQPKNIRDAIRPAFESRPFAITHTKAYEVPGREGLFLLPGHVGLAEYESQLAVAHELSNSLVALQNLPGALRRAIQTTADAYDVDYALIDLSPSLGAINQNLFMTSDAFIIPMAPDLFSSMALASLARILPKWSEWSRKAAQNSLLREADYPYPDVLPKFLGSTVQNFRKRSRGDEEARPTRAFEVWFDELRKVKGELLLKSLGIAGMLLPDTVYESAQASPNEFLMEISAFDSLGADSQSLAKPVFAIDLASDTNTRGKVATVQQSKIDDIRERYLAGAQKIIALSQSY